MSSDDIQVQISSVDGTLPPDPDDLDDGGGTQPLPQNTGPDEIQGFDQQFDQAVNGSTPIGPPGGKNPKAKPGAKKPDGEDPEHPHGHNPKPDELPEHHHTPPTQPKPNRRRPTLSGLGRTAATAGRVGMNVAALSAGVDWSDPMSAVGAAAMMMPSPGMGMPTDPDSPTSLAGRLKQRLTPGRGKDPDSAKSAADDKKHLTSAKDMTKELKNHEDLSKKIKKSVDDSTKSVKSMTTEVTNSTKAQKTASEGGKDWEKSQNGLNGAMKASPLQLIIQGITLTIAAITLLVQHWDLVKTGFSWVYENVLKPVGDWFQHLFCDTIVPAFKGAIDGVKSAFSSIQSTVDGVVHGVLHGVALVVQGIGEILQKVNFQVPFGGPSIGLGGVGDALVGWAGAHMATGGPIHGPGGPRDDIVPIMASNGEYVINAASAAKHAALLDAINNDTLGTANGGSLALLNRSGLGPTRALASLSGSLYGTGTVDHSTTINVTTTETDAAYSKAKTIASQRALTYSGGRR